MKFFNIFLTALLTSSYDNLESRIEDFFRIKYAATSNYRGHLFFASARHGQKAQPINLEAKRKPLRGMNHEP